jgi:AbrB family looped-hinge helix DNA binding protein
MDDRVVKKRPGVTRNLFGVHQYLPLAIPNAIISGMKLSIDQSGRIVIPKPMRKRLGLTSGTELEVVEQAGGFLLRPVPDKPSLIKVDGVWIHQGTAEPEANWERLLDDTREERVQDLLRLR